MIYIYFLLGAIIYSLGTELSYSETLKKFKWYPLLGVCLGICANFIWYSLVQKIDNKQYLLRLALYWDIMIVFCFLLIPIVFHSVKLSNLSIVGISLIIVGIVLTKM